MVALYKVVETNKPGGGMVWNIAWQGPTLYTELAAVGGGERGCLDIFSPSCQSFLSPVWEIAGNRHILAQRAT